MFTNRDRMDAAVRARPPRFVVAAGGDGTVGNVANRLPDIPIAVLPLGTENLLAKYLGIRRDGSMLADLIATGRTRRMDTGRLNEQRFLLMAGVGVDAAVVHRLDAVRTGTISHLSYVQPILRSFRKYGYPPLRVFVDDAREPLMGSQVMVVNLPVYAMGLPFAAEAAGDDGLFNVRVFEKGSAFQMMKYCYKVARRRHESMPDVHSAVGRSVRIECDEQAPVQVDGDPAGMTPCLVTVEPNTIEFVVP